MNNASSSSIQGVLNERRFFWILREAKREGKLPAWVITFRKADTCEDRAGVDGFITIAKSDFSEKWNVPFQIKSSLGGIIAQQQKHRIFWLDNLRYFLVNPYLSDEYILQGVLSTLEEIQRKEERFPRILAWLQEARKLDEERKRTSRETAESISEDQHPPLYWRKVAKFFIEKIFKRNVS